MDLKFLLPDLYSDAWRLLKSNELSVFYILNRVCNQFYHDIYFSLALIFNILIMQKHMICGFHLY